VIGAHHFVADLTLPYGRVLYDYNKAEQLHLDVVPKAATA
jgi:hypothetical protein